MPGATYPRVHVWADNEDVTATALNAEFDNVLNNSNPSGMTGYEASAAQMKLQTTPGGLGTESLATSLAGELERLRFVLARITGTTYWYEAGALSISDINSLLNTGISIPSNRVASGRVGSVSAQALALVPDNTTSRIITLNAATTNLIYYVAGTRYSATANATLSGLTAAPSSNNTCLVNGSGFNSTSGENGTYITVDTMGTEISNLVGKYAAFSLTHGASTEYFIGYVESTTKISKCFRGYFFDSAGAAVPRLSVSDNDVITLMKLTYIFVKTDGTLEQTYTNPVVDYSQPTSPATGDFWFDLSTNLWKRYNGTAFVASGSTLLGVCIQDSTKTVAARTYEYYFPASPLNSIQGELVSTSAVKGSLLGQKISVYGNIVHFQTNPASWLNSGQFATGVTLALSTTYYMYVSSTGQQWLDTVPPYDRSHDLLGFYHPSQAWRAVGYFTTDGSSNFTAPVNYGSTPFASSSARPTGSGNLVTGSVARSAASGSYSTTSASYVTVTNLSIELPTTGRPVRVMLGCNSNSYLNVSASANFNVQILLNGVSARTWFLVASGANTTYFIPTAFSEIIFPGAGTHTIALQVKTSGTLNIEQVVLMAYEMT